MKSPNKNQSQLEAFLSKARCVVDRYVDDGDKMHHLMPLLKELISNSGWLDKAYSVPSDKGYQQYLIYRDPDDKFSLVSFVWRPGQATPIHNHLTWGLVGILKGKERETRYKRGACGILTRETSHVFEQGDVSLVSAGDLDLHQVENASDEKDAISIHIYGGDIGRIQRTRYSAAGSIASPFVSGYSNNDSTSTTGAGK